MSLPSTPRLVEEAIVARMLALDSVPHQQDKKGPPVWHESKTPLDVLLMNPNAELAHLAFSVWCESADAVGNRYTTQFGDDPNVDEDVEDTIDTSSRVRVAFTYALRSGQQTADAREGGNDASAAVARAVLAKWDAADDAAFGTVTLSAVDTHKPAMTPSAGWLLVAHEYTARYDFDLLP